MVLLGRPLVSHQSVNVGAKELLGMLNSKELRFDNV